jgi:hypothetical protein
MMRVAWTGHRPDLFADSAAAREAVEFAARELVERGAVGFLVGGQRGVDTWAGLAGANAGVPLTVILPLPEDEFTAGWSASDRAVLDGILAAATEVQAAGSYSERNWRIATGADLLIAVWTRTGGGGTAETIDFARTAGRPVREIVLAAAPGSASAVGRGI